MKKLLLAFSCLAFAFNSGAQATDLFISEYGEGSGQNKYVEIYNGTGAAVDLSNYELWRISNGGNWPEATEPLAGMLADGDVYVISNSSADAIITGAADITPGIVSWNGDDAVGLAKMIGGSMQLIDAVGESGPDPGSGFTVAGTESTRDRTLVRKSSVCSPDTLWSFTAGTDAATSQWIVSPQDTWTDIGMHTANCSAGCNLTSAGITNVMCNDNGTPTDPSDDFISFDLNPVGGNLGTNYTVTGSVAINPSSASPYGVVTSFTTAPGTAGAGDFGITITDDVDATCTLLDTITDTGVCSSSMPLVTATPNVLIGLDYTVGFGSPELTFDVEGLTLTDDIVISAPTNFSISETSGGPYSSTVTLAQSGGVVMPTTIYLIGTATSAGTYLDVINVASTGALGDSVAVSSIVDDYTSYTIDQITSIDTLGNPDSLDVLVRVNGKVYCSDFRGGGYTFALIDESESGITVFSFDDVSNYTDPIEGDSLTIWGTVSSFNGLIQLLPDSIVNHSNGTINTPTVVTALDETTESQYITLENVSLVDPIAVWDSGSSNYDITNGVDTFTLRVDSDTDIPGAAAPQGAFNVTGIGSQFDNSVPYDEGYQIFPCGLASIVTVNVGLSELTNSLLNGVKVFPNPVVNELNVDLNGLAEASIQIIDVNGRSVYTNNISANKSTIDFSRFESGIYLVKVLADNQQRVIKIIK